MYRMMLLIVVLLLSGCGRSVWEEMRWEEKYRNTFSDSRTYHIGSALKDIVIRQADEVRNINEEEDMYIYVYGDCEFGYIVDRDDPDKKIKSWGLLDYRVDCKKHNVWFGDTH